VKRLDGKPKRKWKWSEEKLVNHPHAEYLGLDKRLLQAFKGCHDRVRDGKCPSIQWPRSREGYIAFMKAIGPRPKKSGKWTVGRIEHNIGYRKGNIRWELHELNSVKRHGTQYQNSRASNLKELRSGL
jgi:hypothetical protein